jgi:CAAX prenyl protease-like protein
MQEPLLKRIRNDPVIARAAPFALFIALIVLASALRPSAGSEPAEEAAIWLAIVRGFVVALVLSWFWPAYRELREPVPAPWRSGLLAVLTGLGVFFAWIYFDDDWAVLSRSPGMDFLGPEGVQWPKALARLVGFAIVVPVMEELFWRSLVLRWIVRHDFMAVDPRRVTAVAFLVTTALFALEHSRWFAGAIAGAAYNAIYMRTGNLWAPILAHAITNASLGAWILYTHNWQYW